MILFFRKLLFSAVFLIGCFSAALAQDTAGIASMSNKDLMADALYVDAVKARMLGEEKQEEELLKQVIKQKPKEAAPHYDLARLYLRPKQMKFDLAEEQIKKAIELNKENPWYQSQYAEILAYQNKFEKAADVYKSLAEKEKYNQDYLLKGAMLYEKTGKYAQALELLDRLTSRVGNDDEFLLEKQRIYLRMNNLDGALKIANQLIDQNPREGRYYMNLAELYESNGQTDKALAVYEKAQKDFPNDPAIQYGLAEHYKKKNDLEKYDAFIRKAILNTEFDDETQTTILFTYLQEISEDSVRRKEGVKITSELAEQHPQNSQVLALYGQVLLNNNEPENAAEQFKRSVAIDPSKFAVWQQMLFIYTGRDDADSLIKYSEKALRLFPNQAIVHYLNGIGHYNKKNYTSAINSMNRAVDLQPDDNPQALSDMYSTLGDVYNAAGNHKESDESFDKAIQLNPKNATVLNNYAYYLSLRGERLSDAEKMSKRSLELRPGEATFLDTYGWILYKQGKFKEAKTYIEDALKANPEADGTLWDHLGDILYKLNDVNYAVELWKTAKEKGTDNPQIDKKIQERKLYE